MWKDMDYYTKRDDDSAIGDSANNSAEEESSNPGRKSIISDDSSDLPLEIHNQLSSKIGIQIPDCLINESEETQTDGRKARKFETSSKSRREKQANSSRNNKSSDKRKDSNQMDLQVQLNFLLNEMKSLRELDRDILRKFVGLNDCIEEVRWRLAENEAKFQRKLAEDDEDEDFFSSLTETRLGDWDYEEPTTPVTKEQTDFENPRTLDTQSYFSRNSQKSEYSIPSNPVEGKTLDPTPPKSVNLAGSNSTRVTNQISSTSVDNPTYSNVDEPCKAESPSDEKQTTTGKSIQLEKINDNNYYRIKSPHSSPSDVWVAREKTKMSQQQQATRKSPKDTSSSSKSNRKENTQESATALARKYNNLILQKQQQQQPKKSRSTPRSASFRSSADETPKTNHRTQWQKMEKQGEVKKVSEFQKQKDYQSLLGLSRVKGRGQVFQAINEKTSGSSGSLNSNSSDSSSSLISPPRDVIGKNRFGGRTRSSTTYNSNNNNNSFAQPKFVTHLPPTRSIPALLPGNLNDAAVQNKRASETSIYNWIRQQKDVSFL